MRICHVKNVAESFVKNIPVKRCNAKYNTQNSGKYLIIISVLNKNKMKNVYFSWMMHGFMLSKIVNCRNNRSWCYENSLAVCEVPFR
jgi:hypothetical protein